MNVLEKAIKRIDYTFKNFENIWFTNTIYEATYEEFNIIHSSECVEARFVNEIEARELNIVCNVTKFLDYGLEK